MSRPLALLYGVICYVIFLATFLLSMVFVWTMDQQGPASSSWLQALIIDAILLTIFALQHSVMARQGFKRWWTKFIPKPIERSTYVLFTSAALLLMIRFWQPIPGSVWRVHNETGRIILHALFALGWLMVLVTTFLIDHFDLFGLKQVWTYYRDKTYELPRFKMPSMYRFVRHPLYLGFIIAFWAAPDMSYGHLFFAIMTFAYILVAIQLEERDLIDVHGEQYQMYRSGVSMLMPIPKRKK